VVLVDEAPRECRPDKSGAARDDHALSRQSHAGECSDLRVFIRPLQGREYPRSRCVLSWHFSRCASASWPAPPPRVGPRAKRRFASPTGKTGWERCHRWEPSRMPHGRFAAIRHAGRSLAPRARVTDSKQAEGRCSPRSRRRSCAPRSTAVRSAHESRACSTAGQSGRRSRGRTAATSHGGPRFPRGCCRRAA
jgi:hypothetical protein